MNTCVVYRSLPWINTADHHKRIDVPSSMSSSVISPSSHKTTTTEEEEQASSSHPIPEYTMSPDRLDQGMFPLFTMIKLVYIYIYIYITFV